MQHFLKHCIHIAIYLVHSLSIQHFRSDLGAGRGSPREVLALERLLGTEASKLHDLSVALCLARKL